MKNILITEVLTELVNLWLAFSQKEGTFFVAISWKNAKKLQSTLNGNKGQTSKNENVSVFLADFSV